MEDGAAYTTVEPSPTHKEALDIVRYETTTGARSVMISAAALIPSGASAPLVIDDYAWSDDGQKLLVFTNSEQVWRENTRGDYWVFDINAKKLTKLGKDAAPSTLMFAKFSPDGSRVGYVRENNLYVEDLATGRITQLTRDGSKRIINGTFDWVYEEELDLRDGWRWSPDGSSTQAQLHTRRLLDCESLQPLLLQSLRMRLAEHELREGSSSVSQLALSLGYGSESAFSNAFKRTTGIAPKRYRSIFAKGRTAAPQHQVSTRMQP